MYNIYDVSNNNKYNMYTDSLYDIVDQVSIYFIYFIVNNKLIS